MLFTVIGSIAIYFLFKPIAYDVFVVFPLLFRKKFRLPTCIPKDIPADPEYVALGSSFAAGPSVGEPVKNSIGYAQGTLCYPAQLASKLNITRFVNAASSGALLSEISSTQLQYLGPNTKLVTLTAGGNDVSYTRDSMLAYYKHTLASSMVRRIIEWTLRIQPVEEREFPQLHSNFSKVLREIKERSPKALIVVVTYITVMPPSRLPPLTESETGILRNVGEKLAQVTRECSKEGALVVDMASLSKGHHALSDDPWVVGYKPPGAAVHPNLKGHTECANIIYQAIQHANSDIVLPN